MKGQYHTHPRRMRLLTDKERGSRLAIFVLFPIMGGIMIGMFTMMMADEIGLSEREDEMEKIVFGLACMMFLYICLHISAYVYLYFLKHMVPSTRNALVEFWNDEDGEPVEEELVMMPDKRAEKVIGGSNGKISLLMLGLIALTSGVFAECVAEKLREYFEYETADELTTYICDGTTLVIWFSITAVYIFILYRMLRSRTYGKGLRTLIYDPETDPDNDEDEYQQAH